MIKGFKIYAFNIRAKNKEIFRYYIFDLFLFAVWNTLVLLEIRSHLFQGQLLVSITFSIIYPNIHGV